MTRIFILLPIRPIDSLIKKYDMGRVYITQGEMRNTYRILVGNPMPRYHSGDLRLGDRTEFNAETYLREIRSDVLNWTELNPV
jgi:hypothetical protein